ncbi:Poly glycohydrolase [Cladochytrium replicatum]|nr:Poly glycohydrolase [Cladochytrium replicatum]
MASTPLQFPLFRHSSVLAASKLASGRGLDAAVNQMHQNHRYSRNAPQPNFKRDILPFIEQKANDHSVFPTSLTLESIILRANASRSVNFSASQILCILANAFLGNIMKPNVLHGDTEDDFMERFGTLEFSTIFESSAKEAVQRSRCLLAYFSWWWILESENNPIRKSEAERIVTFKRVSYQSTAPSISALVSEVGSTLVPVDQVIVYTDTMESARAKLPTTLASSVDSSNNNLAFVDFANKRVHVFDVLPSLTQEEVLFTVCPEAYVSLLLFEVFSDSEVGLIRNARRYMTYTGYGRRFEMDQLLLPTESGETTSGGGLEDFLVMDASCWYHFDLRSVYRDVSKAHHAFKDVVKDGCPLIATGHWGCGVFGGNKYHKFLQQLLSFSLAAHAHGRSSVLAYSVFGEKDLQETFSRWLKTMGERNMTIQQLHDLLLAYKPGMTEL